MDYNKEIEQTLKSLDKIEKAKAPDSFYDDLKLKIDERDENIAIPMSWLKIAAIIIFILNISILYPAGILDFSSNANASDLTEEYFSDYSLSPDSFIELNENEE